MLDEKKRTIELAEYRQTRYNGSMVAQPVSTPDSNISAATVEQQQQQQVNDMGAGIENDMASSVASSYHHQQFHHQHHHYMSKKERLVATSTSKTNLYIKGLGEDTTDKDLFDLCERFGEIKSTKAIIDKATNKCKGYGFVDFKRQEDAKKALSELKKDQHDVQLAKQREQDPTNLYFANLPHDVDEEMLNNMLKDKFNAAVSSTRIMREKNGNSKGVGFARIDDDKLCDKIISELNNQPFPEHTEQSKQILVKLADSCSIIKAPPPPPPSYTMSSSSKIYRQDHYSQPHSINSLDNSSSSFASSATATAQPNDTNNNQYGINNLNLGYRQPQHQFYTHHLNPYEVYNNYQYAIMVDQNGGGYMAPTGQSQAAASAAGYGTNSNIPLLQTPQQQQQQATTTSTATASGASLNSPAAAGNSRQQAQQSYSNHHALIHQSQAFYPAAAASSQHPSAPHNQISSHQMPYYFIANPYQQQTYNYNPSTAHIHQLQAYSYQQQQQQQHSNNPSHQTASNAHQTNVSNTNTPSSTPISQSSSSLAQNMSNLSINSLSAASKPPNNN